MFKFILFAVLLVKSTESRVVREYPLTADGLEIEFEVKNKDAAILKMEIDVNEHDKTVRLIRSQPPIAVGSASGTSNKANSTILPTVDNRSSINVGSCPTGYTQRGGFCFPDDDY